MLCLACCFCDHFFLFNPNLPTPSEGREWQVLRLFIYFVVYSIKKARSCTEPGFYSGFTLSSTPPFTREYAVPVHRCPVPKFGNCHYAMYVDYVAS